MARRMLIDASHPEETRVVVVDGTRLEEFDFETASRKPLKGNIYLAKVIRIEPSLQAAFVEYGGNRHGFLAFSEIHPDYYQIPVADRERLIAEQQRLAAEADEDHEPQAARPRRPHRHRGRTGAELRREGRRGGRSRGGRRGCSRGGQRHSRPRGRARRDVRRGRTGRGRTRRRPAAGRPAGTGALVRAAGAARGNRQRAHRGPGREPRPPKPRQRTMSPTNIAKATCRSVVAPRYRRMPPTDRPSLLRTRRRSRPRTWPRRRSPKSRSRRWAATMPSSSARRASAAAAIRSASTRSRKSSSAGRSCWCRSSRKSAATRARRSPPTCRWPAATAC